MITPVPVRLPQGTKGLLHPVLPPDPEEARKIRVRYHIHMCVLFTSTITIILFLSVGVGEDAVVLSTWVYSGIQEYLDYIKAV